jgi:TRAP-type C4-dicarboxylate transport system permease small subunit
MRSKLRGALDAFGVLCFASVFVAINVQVFMRYIANRPVSWSEEFPTLAFSIAAMWAASFSPASGITSTSISSTRPRRSRCAG